jgi:hypothetical protein
MSARKKYSEDPRIKEWTMKSQAKNFEAINIHLKKGLKDKYKAFAASQGTSVTKLLMKYFDAAIEKAGFIYEPEKQDET